MNTSPERLQAIREQNNQDIAEYVMAMDALVQGDAVMLENWRVRREFWMEQISR